MTKTIVAPDEVKNQELYVACVSVLDDVLASASPPLPSSTRGVLDRDEESRIRLIFYPFIVYGYDFRADPRTREQFHVVVQATKALSGSPGFEKFLADGDIIAPFGLEEAVMGGWYITSLV
ncbi:hypothetical protein HZB90_04050 [archaeon]|nr:hypothetical protein [archaeon]